MGPAPISRKSVYASRPRIRLVSYSDLPPHAVRPLKPATLALRRASVYKIFS